MSVREFEIKHPASIETSPTKKSVQVLLLAGGRGSRLKNSSESELLSKPKPLISISTKSGGTTMIDNAISGIFDAGFEDFVLHTCTNQEVSGQLILEHVQKLHEKNRFTTCITDNPVGTAGATYLTLKEGKMKRLVVTPCDTLFPFDEIPKALQGHEDKEANLTWIVTTDPGEEAQNTGKILVEGNSGTIYQSLEGSDQDVSMVNTEGLIPSTSVGVVIVERDFYLEHYEKYLKDNHLTGTSVVDLYREFIPWLIENGNAVHTFDIKKPAPDLGTPERLFKFGRKN